MKKIRIDGHWDTSQNLTERLLRQFKTPNTDLSLTEFVFDDSYDIGICFNHISLQTDIKKQYYIFPHEPFWSGSHQKVTSNNSLIFGFDKSKYIGNCEELVAHTFYGGRGPWIDNLDIWNYDFLSTSTFNKNKNISSCITELNADVGLYQKRYNLLNQLAELDFIDFYGCQNLKAKNVCRSPYKIDSTSNYKFTICIENDLHKNWITERFFDAILTDCIPIYYGCSNIKELYPEDGYFLLDNIDDTESIKQLLKHINENAESIYLQKITNAKIIKDKYFLQHNLLEKIIRL